MSQEMSWDEWLVHNIERNCSPDGLIAELLKNGFNREQADEKLQSATRQVLRNRLAAVGTSTDDQSVFLPNAVKIDSDKVEMYGIEGFLNADECMQLIELIRANRRESTTVEDGVSSFRTSTTCELASLEHPIAKEIDLRICQYLGIDPDSSEPIEGQWYEPGQEFKAHTDYFEPSNDSYTHHIGNLGQRTWTFMIYLNTTREGGSTYFTELDLNIQPVAGTALLWNNAGPDAQLNPATMHHGTPVEAGYKAVITKWFRSVDGIPRYNKEANEFIKPLTKDGFLKRKVPDDLFRTLSVFYQNGREQSTAESIPDFISNKTGVQPSVLVELTDELRLMVHETLQPLVEAWVGDYIEPTFVYGIREYRCGAELKEHRDRLNTHVASVIINIDQDVNNDWPLIIDDHFYRRHSVLLKPGEMVFYEGARLKHGRPITFDGQRYANVFVHFKIK